MCVFDDKLLLDPTDEEEECSESSVTIVLCKVATDNEICHVHKPGGAGISPDKLHQCIALAKKHSKTIKRLIDTASLNK